MVRTKKQIVEQIAKKKELVPAVDSPVSPLTTIKNPHDDIWSSVQKLQSTFTNLTLQEINEMLVDCGYNEEQVILRLITQANYLTMIRQRLYAAATTTMPFRPIKAESYIEKTPEPTPLPHLASNISRPSTPVPTRIAQPIATPITTQSTQPILSQPTMGNTVQHTSTQPTMPITTQPALTKPAIEKKRSVPNRIITGRLALDDALKQVQDCQNDDRAAFEGWSDARLRAYKMIDKNPNSYYYRFNAPGEQQRKGKWSDEENALFLNRLTELGANTQWGIFSIAIPGRVGYQCSNYYRFLIESGQLQDPNYVIDESGKARYLFDKKSDDGSIEKIFRKHSKHGSMAAVSPKKNTKRAKEKDIDDDDPTYVVPYKKHVSSRVTRQSYQQELKRGQQV